MNERNKGIVITFSVHVVTLCTYSISFLSRQLLPWFIHVNSLLHRFHLWNFRDVCALRLQNIMHSEHILHLLDCNSVGSNDGCIFTL